MQGWASEKLVRDRKVPSNVFARYDINTFSFNVGASPDYRRAIFSGRPDQGRYKRARILFHGVGYVIAKRIPLGLCHLHHRPRNPFCLLLVPTNLCQFAITARVACRQTIGYPQPYAKGLNSSR
jgi:hypothetical protein